MAEVLGVVAAAAQGAEGCLKLYGTFERLYHTSQTLRRYQQRIEEVRQLLIVINDNPAFDTPGISRCTRVLEESIRCINVSIGNRKRDRLLTSISIIIKERQLSETFACIEETKSSLSLYLAGINHKVLYEIRSNSKIAGQMSGIGNEAEIEDMMGSSERTGGLVQAPSNNGVASGYEQPGRDDLERRMTRPESPKRHCQRIPRCEPSSRCDQRRQMDSQSSARFDGNKHTGWASQINGIRLTREALSDVEAARLTNNQVWENHTKDMPKIQKPDGMEASQVNGVQVKGDFRVPRIHGTYRNNVQKANDIQVNGYDL
ncbi:putative Fungal N-terminal domain-containing protein [Seiridium cardinale]|uniref:Fungal N-terminal domain-containing protein n=1 Tax=Seiridium cardinale TaxID=138064 RepID=A0ABR2XDR0_9PEZI